MPDNFTSHALRRTVITHASEMEYSEDLRNRISNHRGSGIDATYNTASHDKQARKFLQVWADKLDRLATKLQVVKVAS